VRNTIHYIPNGLPAPTEFEYKNYALNAVHFALSFTPFSLLFLGALLVSLIHKSSHESFVQTRCLGFRAR